MVLEGEVEVEVEGESEEGCWKMYLTDSEDSMLGKGGVVVQQKVAKSP